MPVLLFIVAAWVIWSPMIVFWLFSLRSASARQYAPVVMGVYASIILLTTLLLSGRLIAGAVFVPLACVINYLIISRAASPDPPPG